jgi:glycosyltransferase involved in cell wall biosynthesis
MSALKILHFMPENFVWGGIESYLKYMLPTLQQSGRYRITAVVTQDSQLYQSLQQSGIDVHGIPFPFRKPSFIRSMWVNPWMRTIDGSIYRHLLPILRREQPDLVHIHGGRIEQAAIRKAGFPMVYTYHGYGGPYNIESSPNPYVRQVYKLARPLFRRLMPAISGMTVVSDYERRRLYREHFLPPDFQVEVLHNGIPTRQMLQAVADVDKAQVRRELGIPAEARVLGFFCRLRSDRNPLAILRIMRQFLQSRPLHDPVYLLVAGDGKLAPHFEAVFRQDPLLAAHGRYLGFRTDVPSLIKASDLTVSTSLHEGFGLRVLESLLLGRPCITYAAGGIPEVMSLKEGRDWLVPLGDEAAFVDRLSRALALPDAELERLAPLLEAHAKRFDITSHVEALEHFYDRVFDSPLQAMGNRN